MSWSDEYSINLEGAGPATMRWEQKEGPSAVDLLIKAFKDHPRWTVIAPHIDWSDANGQDGYVDRDCDE